MKRKESNSYKGKNKEQIEKKCLSNKSIDSKENKINKSKKSKSNTQENTNKKFSMNDNEPGYKIGQYLIKKTLGKGSFGKVKLGIYLPNKEKVAIKIVDKKKIKEKDDLIRIKREFEMLSKFDHPNIILIVEIFETQKRYYSVMEYCEGGELFNYIVKKKYLCEEEASFFFYQLINGLEYIHSLGIVHRDLKPENLLLTENNLLKIIDFGLSNYHDTNLDLLLGTPCGSPCYASPEMVSGARYDGYKIDIWSCGIILFAMICGYLPFEGKENEVLFHKILECQVNLPNYLSEEAKDMLLKILVKDPDKRYSIEQIKNHPFYLKGKKIFNTNFEIELINFDKENKNEKENSFKKDMNKKDKNNDLQNIKLNEKEKNKKTKNNKCKKEKEMLNSPDENKSNHINALTYLPILTDYENNNSKKKDNKKGQILKELSSNNKNNKNGAKINDIKSKKNISLKKIKDNLNIFELFQVNKKNKKLNNKKSNKIFFSKKNFSSGNLVKKISSFLTYKNNYKSNIYERAVLNTDTNYKKKDSSIKLINRKVNTNTNTLKNFGDNEIIYKTHLLTDADKTNINRKLNNISRFKRKTKTNLIKNFKKNQNFIKYSAKTNLLSKIINKCNSKMNSNSKNKKTISKSKDKVTKLSKKRDKLRSYKTKISNINFDINNAGIIDSEYSSYTLKTDPNIYPNKMGNNNKPLNAIHHHSRMINQSNINKRNLNFQMLKQRSIPTLSDFSEFLNRNKFKNDSKKKNLMNIISSDKLNPFAFPKKKSKKIKQNNSINKKGSFFTIRNTMINLNVHTPAILISSYHKIGKKNNNLSKKLNSNVKYINISNYDSDSIFLSKANLTNENSNNKDIVNKNEKKNIFKDTNAKTECNLTIKKSKNKLEYDQLNKKYISNKKHGNYNNMKIGNIINTKNFMIKGYHDKKNAILNKRKQKSHIDNN